MSPGHALQDLALVFAALFVANGLAGRLGQSAVPFYILAGIALQPFVEGQETVGVFALVGVGVLLFLVGLEFSLERLIADARNLVGAGAWDLTINLGLGIGVGLLLGLPPLAATFLGVAFWISSSVIVARSIVDNKLAANAEAGAALGVLVFEDLAIAVILSVLTGVAVAGRPTPGPVAIGIGTTVAFTVGLLTLAHWVRRPLGRWMARADDEHVVGFLFFFLISAAAVAHALHLSEAVGAFLAGVVVAGTDQRHRVERILVPYQQLFAALFFIAFGMMVELGDVRTAWVAGLGLAVLGIFSKILTGWIIGWRRGFRRATRLRLGFLLVPRGEFSAIAAGAAVTLNVPGAERLPPLVAVVVLVLGVTGPILIARGGPRSDVLVGRLPGEEGVGK